MLYALHLYYIYLFGMCSFVYLSQSVWTSEDNLRVPGIEFSLHSRHLYGKPSCWPHIYTFLSTFTLERVRETLKEEDTWVGVW